MLHALSRLIGRKAAAQPTEHPLLALVNYHLGPEFAADGDHAARLTSALEEAMGYFQVQVAAIPGPFDLSTADSALHSRIFARPADLSAALGSSIEVHESAGKLVNEGHTRVHAILATRYKCPANVDTGSFEDHTIRSLAPAEADARNALCSAAIARIVKQFKEHIDGQRRRMGILRVEWELRQSKAPDGTALNSGEYLTIATELQPDNLVQALITRLEQPAPHLSIATSSLPAHEPALPMLHSADHRRWSVCLVSFTLDHAISALGTEARRHRYIYI